MSFFVFALCFVEEGRGPNAPHHQQFKTHQKRSASVLRLFQRVYGHNHIDIICFVCFACFAKQFEKRLPLYKKKGYELYYNDNEDKEEYKKRNYKKKEKEKNKELWESECLL